VNSTRRKDAATTRWRLIIIAGLIVGGLALAGAARWATTNSCRNPAFIMRASSGTGHPVPDIQAIINVTGGLPRSNAWWDEAAYEFPHFLRLAEVQAWRLRTIEASAVEPIYARLTNKAATYVLSLEIEVDYADGTAGMLRWSRWQYGLLLCPFVVPRGGGPEWQIESFDEHSYLRPAALSSSLRSGMVY